MRELSTGILNECVDRLLDGNWTIDDCLARYPEGGDELRRLLEIARGVGPLPHAEIDPTFRVRCRAEILAAIAAERVPSGGESALRRAFSGSGAWFSPAPRRSRFATPLAMLLAGMLVFGGTTGAVFAAEGSLPGNPLYEVKTVVEAVQLKMADSDATQARVHWELAQKRIDEMAALQSRGEYAAIERLARAYTAHIEGAEALVGKMAGREGATAETARVGVLELARERWTSQGDGREQAMERIHRQIAGQELRLARACEQVGDEARPIVDAALAKARGLARAAEVGWRGRGDQAPGSPGPPPWARATAATATPAPSGTPTPPPPATAGSEEFDELAQAIEGLADDPLVPGESYQGLLAKLAAARAAWERDQTSVTLNNLNAFHQQLQALLRAGHVSEENYETLYHAYAELVVDLKGTPEARSPRGQSKDDGGTPPDDQAPPPGQSRTPPGQEKQEKEDNPNKPVKP